MNLDYPALFAALRPETALVGGALVVLGADAFGNRRQTDGFRQLVWALAGLAALIGAWLAWGAPRGPVFGGVLLFDPLARASRLGLLVMAALVCGIAAAGRTERHPAVRAAIVLVGVAGLTLMAAAQQLLLAFLALELASLALYVLAGLDPSRDAAAEAGLKYFLFGGMAAAFLLFGLSLVYGLTGALDLSRVAERLGSPGANPLLLAALAMILVAFGFKSAAAPFHFWAPDVYQGAPTSSAALIASASKLAAITLFVRLLWPVLQPGSGGPSPAWMPGLAAMAGLSILIGNFGALAQSDLRRLLAYSAIAHAGTFLLAAMAERAAGPGPLFYYGATYGLATLGALGVIAAAETAGPCRTLSDLDGLWRRSPVLAGCLAVFVLSLAGIPPLAGFFGKFAVFAAAFQASGLSGAAGWVALAAIGFSAVALKYYLAILKPALVSAPPPQSVRIGIPAPLAASLLASAGLLVLLGVFPSLLLRWF